MSTEAQHRAPAPEVRPVSAESPSPSPGLRAVLGPFDATMIVMGSIIGALYALGRSPEEMRQAVERIDWVDVFRDDSSREYYSFRRKQDVTCRKGLDGGDEGFSRCKVVEDSFRVAVPLVAKTPCHDN